MDRQIAETKLNEYINRGKAKSQQVVADLQREADSRVDVVVPRQMMTFSVTPEKLSLAVSSPKLPQSLHFTEWSESQMLGTLKVNGGFLHGLQADGATGAAIAQGLLNDLKYRIGGEEEHNGKARRFLRVVDRQIKGWLSPTYGVFDQSEILQGFAGAIKSVSQDIVFTDGVISDRRYGVSAVYGKVLEAWQGEYIVIGAQLQSSDYGFGAVDLVQQVIRLVCINGAIGTSFFRKVHRGSGFGGDSDHMFEISDRTRQLSAATTVSLLTDGVKGAFNDKAMEKALDAYRAASAKEINPVNEAKGLREKGVLSKDEQVTATTLIENDVEFLPRTENKHSALRFGQLLSWMAGSSEGEKHINLMEAAGKYYLPA